jgi:ferredoxin
MSQIFKQKTQLSQAKLLRPGVTPVACTWNAGTSQTYFSNGARSHGSCIRCPDMPCIEYRDDELAVTGLAAFPADRSKGVCPTEAITWESQDPSPSVDLEQCIRCGLCVSRCPVGAISLDLELGAKVFDEETGAFYLSDEPVSLETVEAIRQQYIGKIDQEIMIVESDKALETIYNLLVEKLKSTPKLPQQIVRNLMIALGNEAAMRRAGDANVRMELVFTNSRASGTAEVEPGGGILDVPRNLLDNIAVLVSRYGFRKDQISSLAVAFSLPNKRTDYWNVVKDIKNTVDVEIGTISVGALLILLWNRKRFEFAASNPFYADTDSYSIRKAIEGILEREVNLSHRHCGILECSK